MPCACFNLGNVLAALGRHSEQVSEAVAHGQPAITPSYFMSSSDCAASQLQCAQNYIARQHPAASQPLWGGERYPTTAFDWPICLPIFTTTLPPT